MPLPTAMSAPLADEAITTTNDGQHHRPLSLFESVPDAVLLDSVFRYISPEEVARLSTVSVHWHSLATNETLWRQICRATIALHHPAVTLPPPPAPSDSSTPSAEAAVSLSIAQQRRLDTVQAERDEQLALLLHAQAVRATVLQDFRRSLVARNNSFRLAYPLIPQVWSDSRIYVLRHEYVRKGTRDMFHAYEGILRCIYHRCFYLRPTDRTLIYVMRAGPLTECLKVLRRVMRSLAEDGAPGAAAAAASDPAHSEDTRGGGAAAAAVAAAATARGETGAASLCIGSYRLENTTLRLEASNVSSPVVTRWVFSLGSQPLCPTPWSRLEVESAELLERGADHGASTPLPQLEGEEFTLHCVPGLL